MSFRKIISGNQVVSMRVSLMIYAIGVVCMVLYREFLIRNELPMSLSILYYWVALVLVPFVRPGVVFALISSKTLFSICMILQNYNPRKINGIISNGTNFVIATLFLVLLHFILKSLRDTNQELYVETEKAKAATKAKAAFLANMSHEIRTPISGIRGITEMLMETPQRSEGDKKHLTMVYNSSDTLLHLVNNVLDFSRIEAGKELPNYAPCAISPFIGELFETIQHTARGKDIDFELQLDHSLPTYLMIDKMELRQILSNLLSNAIKFTDVGSITMEVSYQKRNLLCKVRDTGIGIPFDKQPQIFTEFERVQTSYEKSREGTGLGLAITKGLIEGLGGRIEVESAPGEGALFIVEIPATIVEGMRKAVTEKVETSLLENGNYKILVAEDNRVNQIYIQHFLEKQGFQYHIVDNGAKAVDAFLREPFNLILMDVQMPVKSGIQATEEIRMHEQIRNLQPTPILALTASLAEHEQKLFLEKGMDEVCPKPIDVKELLSTIQNRLN